MRKKSKAKYNPLKSKSFNGIRGWRARESIKKRDKPGERKWAPSKVQYFAFRRAKG